MFAPTILTLFEEAFRHIKNDEGSIPAVNPAIIFDQKMKNGEFSHLKDYEYHSCYDDMEELNLHIWRGASSTTWNRIFINALHYIMLDDEHIFQLALIFKNQAEISERVTEPPDGKYHYNPITCTFPDNLIAAFVSNPKRPFQLKEEAEKTCT